MSTLRKNMSYLFFINITNYIFPLLTIPYIARIIGPEGVGKLGLAQAVITYMIFFVDFGYNLTATRDISGCKNINERSVIFTSVILTKIALFCISLVMIQVLISFMPQYQSIANLLYIGTLQILGMAFFPVWLFQGMQKMGQLAIYNTVMKFFGTILIFLFVHNSSQIYVIMFIQSVTFPLISILTFILLYKNKMAYLTRVSFSDVKKNFFISFPVFVSSIFTSAYTTLNTLFLSFYMSSYYIGIFSSADKVRGIMQSCMSPVQQTIYPHVASKRTDATLLNKQIIMYGTRFICFAFVMSLSAFLLSKYIMLVLFGEEFLPSVNVFRILCWLPFVTSIAIVFGQWGLLNLDGQSLLGKIYGISGVLHLFYVFLFIRNWELMGLASAILITESLVSIVMYFAYVRKLKKTIAI